MPMPFPWTHYIVRCDGKQVTIRELGMSYSSQQGIASKEARRRSEARGTKRCCVHRVTVAGPRKKDRRVSRAIRCYPPKR